MLGVRPDDLIVADRPGAGLVLDGRVSVVEPLGPESLVYVDVAGRELIAKSPGRQPPAVGNPVRITAALEEIHLFDSETERALA